VRLDDVQKVEVSEDDDDEDNDDEDNDDEDNDDKDDDKELSIEEKELSIEEKNLQSKPLDPRAGRVNVDLPQLPFDPANIAQILEEHRFHSSSTSKSRRQVLKLIEQYVLYTLLIFHVSNHVLFF